MRTPAPHKYPTCRKTSRAVTSPAVQSWAPGPKIDTVAAIPIVQAAAGSKASTVSRVPITPPMNSPERINTAKGAVNGRANDRELIAAYFGQRTR